ncbi:FAD binding domain-containing protein [Paraphaeosphaeria sporulosa]
MGDLLHTQAIETLSRAFPHAVLRPGEPRYEEENGRFWNQDNADVRPAGIVAPGDADETAKILQVLSDTKTPFAIRSGGYMPVPGFNTSPSILISLSRLTYVSLLPSPSQDGETPLVKFGAGNTWGRIYDALSPHGLVVPGARSRPIGVGGFLLYGGVSHFYASVGWACEAVTEFEVALASGIVVTANATQNADLFWALKGGGANFGVVTSFTMRTRKLKKLWGGVRVAVGTQLTALQVFTALHEGIQGDVDEKAHVEVITFYTPEMCGSGDALFVLSLAYAAEVENPVALKGFLDIEAVSDGTRMTTQRDLAGDDKVNVGYDKRGLFRAFSYRGGGELTLDIYTTYYALVKASGLFDADPSAMAALLWLPAGRNLAAGTGVMALGEEAEPYLSCSICMRWSDPSASARIHAIADSIAEKLKKKLRDAGAFVTFAYGNIAGVQDQTFSGLPEKTRRRLNDVARNYDPEGVFQTQVPGFKLA